MDVSIIIISAEIVTSSSYADMSTILNCMLHISTLTELTTKHFLMMSIMTIVSRNATKTMTNTAATGKTGDASSDGPGGTGCEEISRTSSSLSPSVTMSWGAELELGLGVGLESPDKVVYGGIDV